MALRKETVMAQNLQLLGFAAEEPDAAVHAGSFDRPNEKLLLRVLHYLLVTVNPAAAQVRCRITALRFSLGRCE